MAPRRAALVLLAALTCTACLPEGQSFRLDNRVSIVAPVDRQEVSLPVTLRWTVEDFDVVRPGGQVREDAGYFAVFVDRAPMPPGEDLAWLARKDKSCRPSDGCPDEEYFSRLGVYTTSDTEFVIDQVQSRGGNRRDRHTATIVLLDAGGRRIGESAFKVSFDVEKESQQ